MFFPNKVRRPCAKRLAHLSGVIRARDKDERHVRLLFPRHRQGAKTVVSRAMTLRQDDINRSLGDLLEQRPLTPDPNQLAFDCAILQLRANQFGVGVVGFEMNDPQ